MPKKLVVLIVLGAGGRDLQGAAILVALFRQVRGRARGCLIRADGVPRGRLSFGSLLVLLQFVVTLIAIGTGLAWLISRPAVSVGGMLRAVPIAESGLLALAIGLGGHMVLVRWLRQRTFGLELDELTELLQVQQATLYGIRDGVIGLDERGCIRFANEEGRRLANLPHRCVRRPLAVLLPQGRLRDIVEGRVTGQDLLVVHGDRVLVVSRIPVRVDERQLGSVVTIVDRTESEVLLRKLDSTLGLTEALRAQAHDFSNRMHALVGLVELGEYDAAVEFGTQLQLAATELVLPRGGGVGHPVIAALLLAKTAVARERQVQLRVGPETSVEGEVLKPTDVVTVLGNLVDNAIDAAQGRESSWVEVTLRSLGTDLELRVADSGPGVPPETGDQVFLSGFTTKACPTGLGRGVGLAVVQQLLRRRQGTVELASDRRSGGALFIVRLPGAVIGPSGSKRRAVASPAAAPRAMVASVPGLGQA